MLIAACSAPSITPTPATALAVAAGSRPPDPSGARALLGELLQARLAVRRYAVNVNQGIPALRSSAGAPVWRSGRRPAVIGRWTGWTS